MNLLATLLGKVLDPLLRIFLGERFSLAEMLISNRSARQAGREEVVNEARDRVLEDVKKSIAARRAVDPDIVSDKYNRDTR